MRPNDAKKSADHSLHGCFKEANGKLADRNTQLTFAYQVIPEQGTRLVIGTEKVNVQKREKAVRIMASFCPFCGGRL
jgi:hypothetical protein